MRRLGLPKTLLGVDAVRAGRLLGCDLGERELLELLGSEPATLLIGVVGGQGALLGAATSSSALPSCAASAPRTSR